ncbi:inhibitor of growth proteins N-terminal histone-binding-domain-containing protein [Triangularia verruculosa]|uniref:Chromatin modification-related protein n=1 Tax=Triangularia verruculosa TaxID=2587418 RepID=A0AAN6XBL0_9PEZI|nr:inhibitor of growth proteins N-terminal histone-binding-domain-containing protein [Triangularia verruculosa]
MPRDDLSIDFVRKMPPVEQLDPALVLDEFINRAQNLPEEVRFMQEELRDKELRYTALNKEKDELDERLQKWIKAHGSHQPNPKETEMRAKALKNYDLLQQLSDEKLALSAKVLQAIDKHTRHLDIQIKMLYDRNEPGFADPDELPSLVRPSAANITNSPILRPPSGSTGASLSHLANSISQSAMRGSNSHIRNTQAQHHGSASAPATPAASMIMNRQAREGSAGPPKRGPRLNTSLSNLPTTSSGLARHASLGPGTPKGHTTATGNQRAGSAGPRASSKASGSGVASRKAGTPSSVSGRISASHKKNSSLGGNDPRTGTANKSGLSRVKRAAKNSPSSTAESELSDAESAMSGEESDVPRTTNSRGTPSLPRQNSGSLSNNLANPSSFSTKNSPHAAAAAATAAAAHVHKGGPGNHGPPPHRHHQQHDDDDAMDIEEDDAGDDKKYCSCRNVSYGNMVACDNDDCPYEWFHWGCVGLKSEPNGTWFCPDCSRAAVGDRKKAVGGGGGNSGGGGGHSSRPSSGSVGVGA